MISTMATVDDEQIAMPVGDITLTDIISYYQLTPGKEYTLKGVLMDQATEKPLTIDGKQVTSEATLYCLRVQRDGRSHFHLPRRHPGEHESGSVRIPVP